MLAKFAALQSMIFKMGLVVITLLSLFLFWNQTTEFYDTPKFIALIVFLFLMLILSTLKYVTEGKIVLTLSPIDLPLLLLAIVGIISTFSSNSYYVSLFGSAPKVYGSLISLIVMVLFYYLLVNNLKSISDVKALLYSLMIGGVVLSIFTILSYFGIKLFPFTWTQMANFTPTGSSFSTAALLIMLLPFVLSSIIRNGNVAVKFTHAVILTLFGIVLIYLGSQAIFIAVIAVIGLVAFFNKETVSRLGFGNSKTQITFLSLLVPAIIVGVIGLLSYVKLPGNLANNTFYTHAQNFPREIQLPFDTSWNVSISTFRDTPLWGTGLGTYLFNFTTYKPLAFNQTPYWNINFDQPFNEYFLMLSNLGAVGLIALIVASFIFISLSVRVLSRNGNPDERVDSNLDFNQLLNNKADDIRSALAISGLAFFILLAVHVSTLVSMIVGLILIAAFFAVNKNFTKSVHMRLGAIKASSADSGFTFDILPVILILVILVIVGGGSFFLINFVNADLHHRQALVDVANNNAVEAYNQLVKSEQLNPYNDLYRTDLAQTNFAIANAIATAKGPTESSPSGSLNDSDKQTIQQLLQQAIAEGRNAVTISPRSSNNWQILGSIYRQISGVAQNAIQFSLDAYGRSIQTDPLNPTLRVTVGGIYYAAKNYDLATRFFTDAINLKTDYANAYYNLSIALRDKGDLQGAGQIAEQLVAILQKDSTSQDYKTAAAYLNDLKSRVATGSAQESQITPPAAENTSVLQGKKLPKVLDLPKPDQISTPEAVKK